MVPLTQALDPMIQSPPFFVPKVSKDQFESHYQAMATHVGCPAPELSERVYAIEFKHNGQEWTATVGEPMRGFHRRTIRSGGASVERKDSIPDSALVLAIFPGNPYIVVTDGGQAIGTRSVWENPLMAGRPTSITRFLQGKQF